MESDEESVLRLFFKERAEKSTGGEVVLVEWSPTMDILALALADHSIILNRLSWQKVWSISPIKHLPTAMAWRPDGRVLAIGSQSGSVGLYNVENGRMINEFSAGAAITSLSWTKMEQIGTTNGENKTESYISLAQGWSELLPPLPAVDKRVADTYSSDPKLLQPTETLSSLHLLFAGDENGSVHICALGTFLIATIKSSSPKSRGPVVVTRMCPSFKELTLLSLSRQTPSTTSEPALVLEVFETELLASKSCELHNLVLEFGHVVSHLEYLNSILTAMLEAWDDLLFKLDSQLDSYAKTLQEGRTVADEFLVLLACGCASQDLKDFLMFKLTAKGVKKLGLSLEHSYSNIKKFLLHHFQVGIQGLLLHLGELLHMTAGDCAKGGVGLGQFECLGLSPSAVQACVNLAGTVGLKSQEMILAIDHSLRSAKVFFMWLYVTILKLSNEQIPKNMKDDLTPEELKLIVDFLKKRLIKAKSGKHSFNMETVGQYLSSQDLKYTEEKPVGFWEKFVLKYHETMQSSTTPPAVPSVFKPCHDKSLSQLYKQLKDLIEETFTKPTSSMEASLVSSLHVEIKARFQHAPSGKLDPLMCHFTHDDVRGFCIPSSNIEVSSNGRQSCCTQMDLVQYSTPESGSLTEKKTISFYICNVEGLTEKDEGKRCSIVSVRQYDDNNITVLSRYSFKVPEEDPKGTSKKMVTINHSVLAQLPLSTLLALSDSEDAHDVGPILTQVHVLDPFNAGKLAVMGGTRKLAAVVSHNGKKVRLFDTEEDDEDDQNVTLNRSIA